MNNQKENNKILFLGSGQPEIKLIDAITSRGCQVDYTNERDFENKEYDLIISYGYRYIIPKNVIEILPPIINLHISLLPYNRGAHPNFWAHMDNTPSGVTIHLIDSGIDTGPYLFQEEVSLDPKKLTFKESYMILKNTIENLFINNLDLILNNSYELNSYNFEGTFHKSSDLPCDIDWDENIYTKINKLKSKNI